MKKYELSIADKYLTVRVSEDLEALIPCLGTAKLYGLDLETTPLAEHADDKKAGLSPFKATIRTMQIYNPDTDTICIFDLGHVEYVDLKPLRVWMNKNRFIAHNALFDMNFLRHIDIDDLECSCSMILGILIDRAERSPAGGDEEGSFRGYSLAALSKKYLGLTLDKSQQVSDWSTNLTEEQVLYAAQDAVACYMLGKKLAPKVGKYKMAGIYNMFKDMQKVVIEMQRNGMPLSKRKHDSLIHSWEKTRAKINLRTKKYFGDINLNSPKQLGEWLEETYDEEVYEHWPLTPTGAYTFNAKMLADYSHLPEIGLLMKHKKVNKMLSTFGEPLKRFIMWDDRLHPSFSLASVRTGRLSCSAPNLQQMPRGKKIRGMFELPDGYKFVVADFSQIELRVAAELSRDTNMLQAYKDGIDLHTLMAQQITGKKEVTEEERRLAKAVNFGFAFGMGAPRFVRVALSDFDIRLTEEEGKELKRTYYKTFAGYIRWCDKQRTRCKRLGFVRTPTGRLRRLLPEEVYTKSVNTPVQGGAAEVLCFSMLRIRELIRESTISTRIINCVHDEILLEAKDAEAEISKTFLKDAMVYGMLKVFPDAVTRNLVDANIGQSWGEAK